MAFPLKDVRFTTRRSGDRLTVYPRLLRDRAALPKIDIAIQYFESLLGRERRELDPEVLAHFFADHKLARCVVACLAQSYRYRPRPLEVIVTRAALRKLQRLGVAAPKALRARLYDRLNDFGHGFLPSAGREETLGRIEHELGLRRGELERLLYLDAEEHAILVRVGAPPSGEDVVAQYNLGMLLALLRHAERVELTYVGRSAAERAALLALCAANGVEAEAAAEGRHGLRLRLHGRRDALGVWTRHGQKLARTVVQLLERGREAIIDGAATVALKERRAVLRLSGEGLDILSGASTLGGAPLPGAGWADDAGWSPVEVGRALAGPRPAGDGARLRRAPEPRAWAAGVLVPDLLVQIGARGALVCVVRSPEHGARLARIAPGATSGEPLLFAGSEAALAPLAAAGASVLPLPHPDLPAIIQALKRRAEASAVAQVA